MVPGFLLKNNTYILIERKEIYQMIYRNIYFKESDNLKIEKKAEFNFVLNFTFSQSSRAK